MGVRDLKNQLSQYLQYVKDGEPVFITEHHRIIAEISLPKKRQNDIGIEELLEKLAVAGKLQKAKRNEAISSSRNIKPVDWISVYKDNKS